MAAIDFAAMRAELRKILPWEDLTSITLGRLRTQLETALHVGYGELDAQKDAVNAVIHEELTEFLRANPQAMPDVASCRVEKRHKKSKKGKKAKKLRLKRKGGSAALSKTHNLQPWWLYKNLQLEKTHLSMPLKELPSILRSLGYDLDTPSDSDGEEFAGEAACNKTPAVRPAEHAIGLSPTPLRVRGGLSALLGLPGGVKC